MNSRIKRLQVSTPTEWRAWLTQNHDKERDGIWLVFYKKASGQPTLEYEEAVEEALCFGWIDSIIRRIDADRYCRKFTPRREGSVWSRINRSRAARAIRAGKMTEFGLRKIEAAKRSGRWEMDARPVIRMEIPKELSSALAGNKRAKEFFSRLAPSYQKRFIGWLAMAKRPETKRKRLKESMALLEAGRKLGLK